MSPPPGVSLRLSTTSPLVDVRLRPRRSSARTASGIIDRRRTCLPLLDAFFFCLLREDRVGARTAVSSRLEVRRLRECNSHRSTESMADSSSSVPTSVPFVVVPSSERTVDWGETASTPTPSTAVTKRTWACEMRLVARGLLCPASQLPCWQFKANSLPSSPLLSTKLLFLRCALRGELGVGPAMSSSALAGDWSERRFRGTGMNDWCVSVIAVR